jgi:hypothetical protein
MLPVLQKILGSDNGIRLTDVVNALRVAGVETRLKTINSWKEEKICKIVPGDGKTPTRLVATQKGRQMGRGS